MNFNQLYFVILLFIVSPVFSQRDTTKNELQEVIISTQRTPKKQLDIPYSTILLNSEYLKNYQPRTTPEALTGASGVFIQKTNHGGGSPFLRGLTGNQTLLLVDGIRLNNSTFRYGPNQYLNTIDPFTIDKIEVAKGTGSVQYGSDAMGGILQVLTKNPDFAKSGNPWSGKVLGKYMSGDMEKTMRAETGFSTEKVATLFGVSYRNFGDLIGGDTTGRQSPSGYKQLAWDGKVKFLLNNAAELTLAHQFLRQQHVPVYHKIRLENFALNEFDPQQRMLNYARLNFSTPAPLLKNIQVIASWQQTIEGRNARKNGSSVLVAEKDKVNTVGFTTDISSEFSDVWTANSGVELYFDRISSKREEIRSANNTIVPFRGLYPDNSKYGNYSVYSLHHFSINKWIIETGFRYNLFGISIKDSTLGSVKINPSCFVYNASVLYKITQGQSIYTSFNTAYRAPNVDDMGTLGIVDFRYEIPAGDLAPERSRNLEIGYKVSEKKWSAGVSAFYMDLNNLITRVKVDGQVISGYSVYQKENVEEAYIKGMEAEATLQLLKGWTLGGNIALTYGENITKNEPLRRIPPVNGRAISRYTHKKWFAAAELLFASNQDRLAQGDKDDNRIPKGGTPGYRLLNLYAGLDLQRLSMNAGAQNLFNEDYRTHGSGVNGVGRSAWLSIAVKL